MTTEEEYKKRKEELQNLDRKAFIKLIIDRTCSCDIMNGYYCGHTMLYDELNRRLPQNE